MENIKITLSNINKTIKNKQLLSNLSLEFDSKNITAFIGDNGMGKTTTLRTIFGVYKKTAGDIKVNGINFKVFNKNNDIAFIPEQIDFNKNEPVINYLELIANLANLSKSDFKIRLEKLVKYFNLEMNDIKAKKIKDLSAGMQKKVLLISVLLYKPKYIFFDEPTANLDVQSRLEFLKIIKSLNQSGIGICITSHIIEELQEIVNHLIIINTGKIIYDAAFDKTKEKIADIYNKNSRKEKEILIDYSKF